MPAPLFHSHGKLHPTSHCFQAAALGSDSPHGKGGTLRPAPKDRAPELWPPTCTPGACAPCCHSRGGDNPQAVPRRATAERLAARQSLHQGPAPLGCHPASKAARPWPWLLPWRSRCLPCPPHLLAEPSPAGGCLAGRLPGRHGGRGAALVCAAAAACWGCCCYCCCCADSLLFLLRDSTAAKTCGFGWSQVEALCTTMHVNSVTYLATAVAAAAPPSHPALHRAASVWSRQKFWT